MATTVRDVGRPPVSARRGPAPPPSQVRRPFRDNPRLILLGIAVAYQTNGSRVMDRERMFEDLAAPIRLGLITLYLWSFVHKLNTGWLDPAGGPPSRRSSGGSWPAAL